MAKTGSFQINKFDPILMLSQICALQSILYFTLSIVLLIGLSFLNINLSLSALFDFRVRIISCLVKTKGGEVTTFFSANQRFKRRRSCNYFIIHHKFAVWCNLSLDFCETTENVSRFLVNQTHFCKR